ncbi:glycosyltransferase [Asticcacaulis sp. W401b]|uniref:glycosyltransferase n=1 Tax=Asticcacaulis sp. W401b TaxID=3388666 RepID=UPI003970E61F
MKIEIWHNIMWSKYKAVVFSELNNLCSKLGHSLNVFQFGETEGNRVNLSGIDKSYHEYEYKLLFKGSLDKIPVWKRIFVAARWTALSKANVIVLAGYDKPEYWVQLLILKFKSSKIGVFCDSTAFDNPQTRIKSMFKSAFLRSCDRVFCYGIRAKEYVMSFGVREEKISFRCQSAALPKDYDRSLITDKRVQSRKLLSNSPRLLYVGRLSPEKSLDVLIESWSRYIENSPNATLRIVGSGPQEEFLKVLTKRLNLGASVNFLGPKSGDDLYKEYLDASALILPSYSEPWGLVVNEAFSFGCPAIVSNRCGCVPELVIEDITGISFDLFDPNGLYNALLRAEALFTHSVAETSSKCLSLIQRYSPSAAAEDIYNGLVSLVR